MSGATRGGAALVTGSANNIGRAIALRLAADGFAVMVHARQSRAAAEATVRAIEAAGGAAALHLADISRQEEAAGLVTATVQAFGGLNVLVNNASLRRQTAFADITPAEWREVLGATLDGSFFVSQAAAPHLLAAPAAALINLGGMAAHTGTKGRVHAIAAKAAIAGLTRALAHEFAGTSVRVNSVAPGMIETVRAATVGAPPALPPNLVGHGGLPDDVAAMVAFLAGPGGRYVTGQTIHVNGGAFLA